MSSNFRVIGAILFVCGSCFAQAPTSDVLVPSITNPNSSMKLEDSTPVILRTKQDLSSATVKVGDRVPFLIVKDVRVADLVVIPRGADAWGLVTAVQPKRRKGRPGTLAIAIQFVQLLTVNRKLPRTRLLLRASPCKLVPLDRAPQLGHHRPVETRCAQCGAAMSCRPEGGCWCAELPHFPMPADAAGCLCRNCLLAKIEALQNPSERKEG
jgi:hypothetical protein